VRLSIRRRQRMNPESWRLWQLTMDGAGSSETDMEVVARLSSSLAGASRLDIDAALARLGRKDRPISYRWDRALRLLQAAASGDQVLPMPTEYAQQFARERELGHLPMEQAYAELSRLVPGLTDLESRVKSWEKPDSNSAPGQLLYIARQKDIRSETARLVGPAVGGPDPVLRSNMAAGIAQRYLYSLLGNTELGDAMTPFFSAPTVMRSEFGGTQ
jgi:hypothetical protein